MKKPAKPKPRPKRRGQKTAALRSAGQSPSHSAGPSLAARDGPKRLHLGNARFTRSIAAHYSSDDRAALAMLLVPFLILSAMLASSQAWRQTRTLVPDLLARHSPVAPRPAPIAPAPPFAPPGATPAYPPAPPAITVASSDLGMMPSGMALPGPAPAYPPAAPAKSMANLDARPPVAALPGKPPTYGPAMPWFPPADRATDVAAWSAPLNAWQGRLRQPPTIDIPQAETWTSDGSTCLPSNRKLASYSVVGPRSVQPSSQRFAHADQEMFGQALARAALAQTSELVFYTARYRHIAYPMGDIASMHGACTDVVIRAYRALGVDLQQLVHEFRSGRSDPNIDHRRTEMLRRFFTAQSASLPITPFPEDYKPGDVVTYHRPYGRISNAHIAIVSDRLSAAGRPMVIHNRGFGAQLEDALFADRITGHYRFAGPPPATLAATSPLPRGIGARRAGFSPMSFSTGGIPRRQRQATTGD